MINIVSTYYITNNYQRNVELDTCIVKNLNSIFVESINLFVDDAHALEHLKTITNNSYKIKIIQIGLKPMYSDYFKYIIDNLNNKICMITNSDIYIHLYNEFLIGGLNTDKVVYALTRHEHDLTCPLIDNYCGSHDCYIFNSSFINNDIMCSNLLYYQNFPGIESRIIKTFCDNKFTVLNPCKQIVIVHLHSSGYRQHGEWIGLHGYCDTSHLFSSCWYIKPNSIWVNIC